MATRVFDRVVQTRAEQDNEQWHLLILQDLAQRRGVRQSFIKHRLAPWLIAFVYYRKHLAENHSRAGHRGLAPVRYQAATCRVLLADAEPR